MKNRKFPKTPLSTPLARPGEVTRQRIRRIVRFPNMKSTPAFLVLLAALAVLLCGNLAACQSAEEPPQGGSPLENPEGQGLPMVALPPSSVENQTVPIPPSGANLYQGNGAFVGSVPLSIAGGRSVTVELYGASARPEHPDYYAIDELQVWEGAQLLQTIRADELSYDGPYLFEGLFDNRSGDTVGRPDHRDINFDGSEDLGLLAAETYPHNVPYCYLFWDEAANQLSTQPVMLFAPVELDAENRQVVEAETDGPFGYINYYGVEADGSLSLLRREEADMLSDALQAAVQDAVKEHLKSGA